MNKKIVLSSILVAFFCTLIFGSSALAHSPTTDKPKPKHICYTVLVNTGGWIGPKCDREIAGVAGDNGILAMYAEMTDKDGKPVKSLCYVVAYGGSAQPKGCDGDQVGDGKTPITAMRVWVTPVKNVTYTCTDNTNTPWTGVNGSFAGKEAGLPFGAYFETCEMHFL